MTLSIAVVVICSTGHSSPIAVPLPTSNAIGGGARPRRTPTLRAGAVTWTRCVPMAVHERTRANNPKVRQRRLDPLMPRPGA
jgi:hypothetical protein